MEEETSPASDGSMTWERAMEIENMIKEGREDEVPRDELQEYQEYSERFKEAIKPVIDRYTNLFASSIKTNSNYQTSLDNLIKHIRAPLLAKNNFSTIRFSPAAFTRPTSVPSTEHEPDDEDSGVIEVELSQVDQAQLEAVGILKAMAFDISGTKAELKKVKRELKQSNEKLSSVETELEGSKASSRRESCKTRWMLIIASFSLIVAAVTLVWSMLNNDGAPDAPAPSSPHTQELSNEEETG